MTTSFPGFPETTHDNKVLPPPFKKLHVSKFQSLFPSIYDTLTHRSPSVPKLAVPTIYNIAIGPIFSQLTASQTIPSPHIHLLPPPQNPHVVHPSPRQPPLCHPALTLLSHLIPSPRIPYLLPNPPHLFRTHSVPPRYLQQSFSSPPNKQSILIVSKAVYLFLSCTSLSDSVSMIRFSSLFFVV